MFMILEVDLIKMNVLVLEVGLFSSFFRNKSRSWSFFYECSWFL